MYQTMNCKSNMRTQSGKDVKPIGFGPGIVSWLNKRKKPNGFVAKVIYKIWYKIYILPTIRSQYVNAISNALKLGFNLLDYSSAYGDGALVGSGIRKSRIKREDIYITTRVSNIAQREGKVREELFSFLENTGIEYVDLLQIHWPVPEYFVKTWKEMEQLREEGYVKHLGVANCHPHHLEEIFRNCKYRPEVGQFEIHPLFTQKDLINYYKKNNILVEAYTPIARYDDRLVRLPLLKRLEKKYNKTFVQIILRWHIQNGVIPLVRSLTYSHQKENFNVFDFSLDDADMVAIDAININSRLRFDPDNCDFSIL